MGEIEELEGKTVSDVILPLLLLSALTLGFNMQPVKAVFVGGITIRNDGSVDPPTAPITNSGNVSYTLTDNINGSITVQRNNIVIDGAGHVVQGSQGYASNGIDLTESFNVTVKNVTIKAFSYGIHLGSYLSSSTGNIIYGNYVTNNSIGIYFDSASHNTVVGNIITNNSCGLSFYTSFGYHSASNNIISGNNITNNNYAMTLNGCPSNIVSGNTFINKNQIAIIASPCVWDDGYPAGGNYWSDYRGADVKGGPDQNTAGSDGMGDTPYNIDSSNRDRYPLMGPFAMFDVGIWIGETHSMGVFSNSTIDSLDYTKSNSRITMHVSNMTANQTYGFCRLTIPRSLMSPPYSVLINDNLVSYTTVFENETLSIIYLGYNVRALGTAMDYAPYYIGGGIVAVAIAGVVLYIVFRRRKKRVPSSQ